MSRTARFQTDPLPWYRLNQRQLDGIKFRRRAPVGVYIADFLSHDAKLVIELDGDTHAGDAADLYDERRSRFFEQRGFRVIRFWNGEVRENLDFVVERIRLACGLPPIAGGGAGGGTPPTLPRKGADRVGPRLPRIRRAVRGSRERRFQEAACERNL